MFMLLTSLSNTASNTEAAEDVGEMFPHVCVNAAAPMREMILYFFLF